MHIKKNSLPFMRKTALVLSLLILVACGVQKIPQSELDTLEPVKLYETTNDYLNRQPMEVDAGVLIKDKSDQHITIKGIFDLNTGLKVDRAISAWALEYNHSNYFNLGYSTDVNHWASYAKFDIEGKYCAIFIDDNSPNVLKTTSTYYGGGLSGVLMAESLKWNKNWKDKNGIKKKILFIDTQDISPKMRSRNTGSIGNYLTRKQFQKILDDVDMTLTDEKIKDIEFEVIVEVIETANKNNSIKQ